MDYSLLSGAPLFSGIPVNDIEKIVIGVSYHFRKFRTGSLLRFCLARRTDFLSMWSQFPMPY